MKKLIGVFITILFVMVMGRPIQAQEAKMIAPMPPISDGMDQLFGQNQWYTVVFRGNGEAVVNARVVVTNSDTKPMKTISLRVPRVVPQDAVAFQVIQERQCVQYSSKTGTELCIQYDDFDAYNWYGPAKYQKAALEYSGDTLAITLSQPVQPNASGSILLYYRAFGYAKKDLVGGYRFTFETLQADQPVQELQVGISIDSDLILRGTKSEVNYRFEDSQMATKGVAELSAPVANTRMDAYVQQIGAGEVIKTASNLQAFESYTVRGSYADSRLKLYAKEIGIGIGMIILFAAIGYGIVRRIFRAKQASHQSTNVLAVFGLSFISAIVAVGYSAVVMYIAQNISQLFGYQAQTGVTLLLLVISLGVYGLLLGAPALFMGMKRGLWYGLATAGMTVLWLILALLIYLILNVSGKNPEIYPMGVMDSVKMETQIAPAEVDTLSQ